MTISPKAVEAALDAFNGCKSSNDLHAMEAAIVAAITTDERFHPEWTLSHSHNEVLKDMRKHRRPLRQEEECNPATCSNGKCRATGECVEEKRPTKPVN
jgi:hypothetical protein